MSESSSELGRPTLRDLDREMASLQAEVAKLKKENEKQIYAILREAQVQEKCGKLATKVILISLAEEFLGYKLDNIEEWIRNYIQKNINNSPE